MGVGVVEVFLVYFDVGHDELLCRQKRYFTLNIRYVDRDNGRFLQRVSGNSDTLRIGCVM